MKKRIFSALMAIIICVISMGMVTVSAAIEFVIDINLPLDDTSEITWIASDAVIISNANGIGGRNNVIKASTLANNNNNTVGVMLAKNFAFQEGDVLTYSVDLYAGTKINPDIWLRNHGSSLSPFATFYEPVMATNEWVTISKTFTFDQLEEKAGDTGSFTTEGDYALYLRPRQTAVVYLDNFKAIVTREVEDSINPPDPEPEPDEPDEPTDPSPYTYEIMDGEVTITGTDGTLVGDIEIPEYIDGCPVTAIGDAVFFLNSGIESVSIPDTVTSIGSCAFYFCENLSSINMPKNLKYIGVSAFEGCSGLTSLTIPGSVETVDGCAFLGCSNLTSVTIEEGVQQLQSCAFNSCKQLTSITIPDSVTTISDNVFAGCENLTSIYIGKGVTSIGGWAFSLSGLTDVYYAGTEYEWNNIAILDDNSILLNANIHFVDEPIDPPEPEETIPYTYEITDGEVTITGNDGTLVGDIEIPEYIDEYPVTAIGGSAFAKLKNVNKVTVPKNVKVIGNSSFMHSEITEIVLPEGLETIEDRAFYYSRTLARVNIPSSVTKIGGGAFQGCGDLEGITIPDGLTVLNSGVFWQCQKLTEVVIPDSVELIKTRAFKGCISLTSVTIPDNVYCIEDWAFQDCTGLTEVTIPTSITTIADAVFDGCINLTDVYYAGTEAEWNAITIGDTNEPLLNAVIHFADDPINPPEPDEPSPYTYEIANGKVTITGSDSSISGDIEIPDCIEGYPVTKIGQQAFYNRTNITSVNIPDSVTRIGEEAFRSCSNLTSVVIPACTVDDYAFACCYKLIDVDMECEIGDWMFYACESLRSINIPEGTWVIKEGAFARCKKLTSIYIPASVTVIKDEAFDFCDRLTDVYYDGTRDEWNNIRIGIYNEYLTRATFHRIEKPDEPTDGEIIFNIADTTTQSPISGAKVIIVTEDGEAAQEIVSDADGIASLDVPNGTYTVQVMASGYDIRTFTVEKTDENNEFSVYLNKNPLVKIETKVKEMTKKEMVDAGIDVEATENKHIYKCTTVVKFTPITAGGSGSGGGTPVEFDVDYIYDDKGVIINAKPVRQDGIVIYPVAKDVYLIVHSETTWVKEMFDVQLVVANTSSVEKIKECEINLDLPNGLSLATMVDNPQSATVYVEEIKPLESKDIHWYVRGDAAGEYVIGGDITGKRQGGGITENLNASFTMQDPITVLAGDAMKLTIEAERFATAAMPYKMKYTLQNVSSRTLYDVALNVLGGKFRKAYSVQELKHNGELVNLDGLGGVFNDGIELGDEEFKPGEVLTGVFEITFGQGIVAEHINYMATSMFTFTGEGSTTTIPTEVIIVDGIESHVYDSGTVSVAPTCDATGIMIYRCTTCPETMTVVLPKLAHEFGNWKVIEGPTCHSVGEKNRECVNCDFAETAEIGKTSHKYDYEVTKEPTTTTEGIMTYTCSMCEETKTAEIPVCTVGDMNGDTDIDIKDVVTVRRYIAGGSGVFVYTAAGDINKDGRVEVKDIVLIRRYIAGGYGVEL